MMFRNQRLKPALHLQKPPQGNRASIMLTRGRRRKLPRRPQRISKESAKAAALKAAVLRPKLTRRRFWQKDQELSLMRARRVQPAMDLPRTRPKRLRRSRRCLSRRLRSSQAVLASHLHHLRKTRRLLQRNPPPPRKLQLRKIHRHLRALTPLRKTTSLKRRHQ